MKNNNNHSCQSRKWPLYLLTLVLLAMSAFPLSGQDKFRQTIDRFRQNAPKQLQKSLFELRDWQKGNMQLPGLNAMQKTDRQSALPQFPPVDTHALFSKWGSRASQPNAPLESTGLLPPDEVAWANAAEAGTFFSTGVAADAAGNNYTVGIFSGDGGGSFITKRNVDGEVEWTLPILSAGGGVFTFTFLFGAMQVAVGNDGNIYVCGGVVDDATFIDIDDDEFLLPVTGGGGSGVMFLACYSSAGNLEWVRSSADDAGVNMATGIDVDNDGNIYVCGTFTDTITLGPGEPNETTLAALEDYDAFWAKFNSAGELQWAKAAVGEHNEFQILGVGTDGATDIAVDNDGNVYIAGYFEKNLAFEVDTPEETLLEAVDFPWQNFIAKYTTDGDFIRASSPLDLPYFLFLLGEFPLFWSPDIVVAPNGAVYFSSTFLDFFDVDESFSFILAMDGDGDLIWESVNFSEEGLAGQVFDIGTDAASNVYAHGSFLGDVLFNAENENSPPFELSDASGSFNIFLEKLDSEGCFQWARSETPLGSIGVVGAGLAVDENCVFVTANHFDNNGAVYGADEANETLVERFGAVTVKYNRNTQQLHDFTLLAAVDIEVSSVAISSGDMHANDDITFNSGAPSAHNNGSLSAVDDIAIARDNTINGDVTAGGDLDNDGAITGEANEGADVDAVALPVLAGFSAGDEDVTVESDGDVALPPGSYRDVVVERDGLLRLSSGEYFMDELELGTDARIFVDLEEGDVTLHIVSDLEFGDRSEVVLIDGSIKDFTIKSIQTKNIDMGREARVQAVIIAPEAKVRADSYVDFRGIICAEDISFGSGAIILHPDHNNDSIGKALADREDSNIAQKFALDQNYPNPFNPTTHIGFRISDSPTGQVSFVELKIYDVSGKLVKTLVNENREAGSHTIQWNATNDFGQRVTSGIYLYKLISGSQVQVKKMILLK